MTNATTCKIDNDKGNVQLARCGDNNGYAHYWEIDDMNIGKCKKCGSTKQFLGYCSAQSTYYDWDAQERTESKKSFILYPTLTEEEYT